MLLGVCYVVLTVGSCQKATYTSVSLISVCRTCGTGGSSLPSVLVQMVLFICKLIFAFSSLPSYTNDDPIGVELAGAGKVRDHEGQEEVTDQFAQNVYALAAGVAAGLGFENNARAGVFHVARTLDSTNLKLGLITRSLAEYVKIRC